MSNWTDVLTAEGLAGIVGIPVYIIQQAIWQRWHQDSHAEINNKLDYIQEEIDFMVFALGLGGRIPLKAETRMNFKQLFDGIMPQTKGVTMEIYRQGDERWATKPLGSSPFIMRGDGCYITAIAQLLTLSGREITPGNVCDALNGIEGFTEDGLVIHDKVTQAYPEFHYVDTPEVTQLISGDWGLYTHFLAGSNGAEYDPWYGLESAPAGFKETGRQNIVIDALPEPTPETPVFEPHEVTITAEIGAHVRQEPNTQSAIINPGTHQPVEAGHTAALTKGATFVAVGVVDGEDIDGNNKWYHSQFGNYIWTGACS